MPQLSERQSQGKDALCIRRHCRQAQDSRSRRLKAVSLRLRYRFFSDSESCSNPTSINLAHCFRCFRTCIPDTVFGHHLLNPCETSRTTTVRKNVPAVLQQNALDIEVKAKDKDQPPTTQAIHSIREGNAVILETSRWSNMVHCRRKQTLCSSSSFAIMKGERGTSAGT